MADVFTPEIVFGPFTVGIMQPDAPGKPFRFILTGEYTPPAPDVTAPVLSSPAIADATSTTATLTVSSNEASGILYWVVSTASTTPSAAQIKLGQMHTGAAAADAGTQAVAVTGAQVINVTPLSSDTDYYGYFVQEDAALNQSNIAVTGIFATDSDGLTPPVASDDPTLAGLGYIMEGEHYNLIISDFGTYTPTPTSFDCRLYKDDILYAPHSVDLSHYAPQDIDNGADIKFGLIPYNGAVAGTEVFTNEVTANIPAAPAAGSLARISASGATFDWEDTLGANTYSTMRRYYTLASDAGLSTVVWKGEIDLTAEMIDGTDPITPAVLAVSGLPDPPFGSYDDSGVGEPADLFLSAYTYFRTPLGTPHESAPTATIQKTDGVAPMVMNSFDAGAGVMVTDGGLTVEWSGVNTGIHATRQIPNTGKYYVEVLVVARNTNLVLGLTVGGAVHTAYQEDTTDGFVWLTNGGFAAYKQYSGGSSVTAPTVNVGDRVMLAFNMDSSPKRAHFGVNGTWQGGVDPSTVTGGLPLSGIAADLFFYIQGNGTAKATAAFLAADQTYSAPSGFGEP